MATSIDTAIIINISVDSIGNLDVPEVNKESAHQEVEKKVFRITTKVHKMSKHRDGDIKIKLTNSNDVYINYEAPYMDCTFIQSSVFFSRMERVRNWIEPRYEELEGKTVTIIGAGFINIDHRYPRNAAKMKWNCIRYWIFDTKEFSGLLRVSELQPLLVFAELCTTVVSWLAASLHARVIITATPARKLCNC